MTATLISLISIVLGITGANTFGVLVKKMSFGLVGNTIAGVFGSIIFIKSFGRLGFNPQAIVQLGETNFSLLVLNCIVSFFGGALSLYFVYLLKSKLNR
ncbi:hypothetical protein KCTC52924_03237 [Arenibacter antarcticus]|uniref:Fluoride ion transporter CrcB n=1 Tax=Arenibacter antarcticus TaxID=2040469 RepID=A0ABW5VG70_9FLAO|nr:hypothetical protein [Arenibacter sp. H213]MCM4166308.1 hypothetical protein [Arenibacter sp. H213]